MFLNRISELEVLEQMYKSENAEFFVLYGRRRVGKTDLLQQLSGENWKKLGLYFN